MIWIGSESLSPLTMPITVAVAQVSACTHMLGSPLSLLDSPTSPLLDVDSSLDDVLVESPCSAVPSSSTRLVSLGGSPSSVLSAPTLDPTDVAAGPLFDGAPPAQP